ncbi:hypothetical protein D9756_010498 [Leucocoprinus leucothites]|uniref:Uncharacterized protein n=1 Tax=Leucocoprinus leucothites TaxID=201217 RepID=A0A8H5CUK3_9AGAR|nr:hypothetical protein D9756_010498 [Leucoagaricus leucothites]
MQLKSIFFLAFTAAPFAFASTLPEVLGGISQLGARITVLEGRVTISIPVTGGTQQVMTIHGSAANVLNAIDSTVSLITQLEKPVPTDACNAMLNAFQVMVPGMKAGFQAAVAKKNILTGFGAGRGAAVLGLDLINLRKGAVNIEVAALSVLPSDCADRVTALRVDITDAIDVAIAAYNSTN